MSQEWREVKDKIVSAGKKNFSTLYLDQLFVDFATNFSILLSIKFFFFILI
jgi:hypothetical protein